MVERLDVGRNRSIRGAGKSCSDKTPHNRPKKHETSGELNMAEQAIENEDAKTVAEGVLTIIALKLAEGARQNPEALLKAATIGIINMEMDKQEGTLHPLGMEVLEQIYKEFDIRDLVELYAK